MALPKTAPRPLPQKSPSHIRQHALAVILIVVAAGAINLPRVDCALGWSDGPNHLFDGIFLFEFARAFPIEDPMGWAEQFYLRHPTLGIVVYWPPGFAAIEALVFAVFGVSLLAARCLVLAFVIAMGVLLYALGRQLFKRNDGLWAALLLIGSPAGVRWAGDVMLEWPATFWITFTLCTYVSALAKPKKRWPVLFFGVGVVMAFLTKQTAGIVLPVVLLHAIFCTVGRRWLFRPMTMATGVAIAMILLTYGILASPFTGLPSQLLVWSPDVIFYGRHLPEMIGWPGLIVMAVGCCFQLFKSARRNSERLNLSHQFDTENPAAEIAASMHTAAAALMASPNTDDRFVSTHLNEGDRHETIQEPRAFEFPKPVLLLVIWMTAWWAFSTVIAAKEPRYFFFALPPLLLLGCRGWCCFVESRLFRIQRRVQTGPQLQWQSPMSALILLALVVGQAFLTAWAVPATPPSYRPAIDALVARGNADLVLVDAVRDGQFVYDTYADEQARASLIPLRASKLLYARAARMKYSGVELVQSKGEIVDILDEFGIRYIVMESRLPATHYTDADPRPRKLLRELVTTDGRFRRIGAWPLACDDPAWDEVALWLIEYANCPARRRASVDIPVPAMGKTVTIDLVPTTEAVGP